MMRNTWLVLGVLLAVPVMAQAQEEGARAGQLRQQIEERFTARVQEDLGLSDKQTDRLREVSRRYFARRRDMEAEERRLRQALAGELRPGVAANNDRVQQLTDQILENKVRYVVSYQDEMKELRTFLTPVQCAQFLALRERLLDRVKEVQENPPRRRLLRNQ
jgi:phytoene/squalene synthetase